MGERDTIRYTVTQTNRGIIHYGPVGSMYQFLRYGCQLHLAAKICEVWEAIGSSLVKHCLNIHVGIIQIRKNKKIRVRLECYRRFSLCPKNERNMI